MLSRLCHLFGGGNNIFDNECMIHDTFSHVFHRRNAVLLIAAACYYFDKRYHLYLINLACDTDLQCSVSVSSAVYGLVFFPKGHGVSCPMLCGVIAALFSQ